MTLGDLLAGWAPLEPSWDHLVLTGLTADSRAVKPGDLFVALPKLDRPGFRHDGHDFVAQAVAAGAVAVLATHPVPAPVPVIVVDDTRLLLGPLAAAFHGQPSRELTLVGVTGTNGKTTITYLLEAIFRANGWRTVVAGTVETRLGDERRPATTTTPDPVTLQRLWREAVDQGITAGAMEVSSHALHQHRTDGTHFAAAVFTNLTQDHLDYHESLEEYFESKVALFYPDLSEYQPLAVINADDAWGRRLLDRMVREPRSFGEARDATVRAEAAAYHARGSVFRVASPEGTWEQHLRLPGRFNVSNALGAIGAALTLGLSPDVIAPALASCAGAPGRVQAVDAGQPFGVFVDYAHTPDALEQVIAALRPVTAGRLITVFGCGGNRDRTKRPQMGAIAAAGSDRVVVTSDNPRTEDAAGILDDIVAGIAAGARAEVEVEVDRRVAIGRALAAARAGDTVLIAGKGHEDYQILGSEKHPFDDRAEALAWLEGNGPWS
jgi:UDP-N-acetylmuramoyl-L-alanyl-D-glutamate--2,6-diaminopimelate ligase